jgi:hypothetical protein
MEALSGGLGGLVIDNDMDKTEVERINIFHTFVKQKIQVCASSSGGVLVAFWIFLRSVYWYHTSPGSRVHVSIARLCNCMEAQLLRGKKEHY